MLRTLFLVLILLLCCDLTIAQNYTGSEEVKDSIWAVQYLEKAEKSVDSEQSEIVLQGLSHMDSIITLRAWQTHFFYPKYLHVLGRYQFRLNQYDEALGTFEKATNYLTQAFSIDTVTQAKVYRAMGVAFSTKGAFDQALNYLETALELRISQQKQDQLAIAEINRSLGITSFQTGKYSSAETYFKEAINRLQQLNVGSSPEKETTLLKTYNGLGVINDIKGELDESLRYYQSALGMALRLENEFTKNSNLGAIYQNIGTVYFKKADFFKALDYYKKALKLKKITYGENNISITYSLNGLGICNSQLGKVEESINYFTEELALLKSLLGETHPRTAVALLNIAVGYGNLGEYEPSLANHTKSLEILIQNFGEQHYFVADSYYAIGESHFEAGKFVKAKESHKKALDLRLELFDPKHPQVLGSYYKIGTIDAKLGLLEPAERYYAKVLDPLLSQSGEINNSIAFTNLPLLINGLANLGHVLYRRFLRDHDDELLKTARTLFKRMDNSVISQRNNITVASKKILSKASSTMYEKAIAVNSQLFQSYNQEEDLELSFMYAERTKALSLLEGIQQAKASNFSGLPKSLIDEERQLLFDLTQLDTRAATLLAKGANPTDSIYLQISSERFDLITFRDSFEQILESQYPDYYRLKYDNKVIDVNTVQDELLNPEETLLEYFVGDSSIYLFVIRQDRYEVTEVKHDFPLVKWVDSLRQSLSGNYRLGVKTYAEIAYKLYQKLIEPVADQLTDRLIIIPDGILGYLPFEALLTESVKRPTQFNTYSYLLQQKQISYCYSATLLKEMREKRHRRKAAKGLLAFAPFYDGDTTLFANLFSKYSEEKTRSEGLEPLKYTGEEVYGISQLIPGDVFYDSTATEEKFVQLAKDYRVIHLATHGRANDRVGDYSFLAFTEIKDSIENELLYVRDLYNLQLNADMVVLSACETGIGELQRGEGIISLARGFTYAGAKSILTTLWRVNDERTKDLMLLFYEGLKDGLPKDEALRQAKLRFIKGLTGRNTRYAHPYFWSGLIAIGDMSEIVKQ